jgi:urease accessory protein
MNKPLLRLLSASLLFPTLAFAHSSGTGVHDFQTGFLHPFSGLDHLLAMLAVGLWASQLGGRAQWQVPLTFVAVMAVGSLIGIKGGSLPLMESGIALSLLLVGVMIAASIRLPLAFSCALVGIFALCHGAAHGAELPFAASAVLYATGFLLATALLHLTGIVCANHLKHINRDSLLRWLGGLIAVSSGYFWLNI